MRIYLDIIKSLKLESLKSLDFLTFHISGLIMSIIDNFKHNKKAVAVWNLEDIGLSNHLGEAENNLRVEIASSSLSDEHLVIASQQGDIKAFEMLICKYQRQIFSLIYQMTHDVEVVEDIAQDVFIAAFKAIKDFQAKSSFFTWLYRIAINHCKNYLTSSARAQNIESRFQREYNSGDLLETQEGNPQNMLLTKEFVEQIEEAILGLPEEQRIVLILCEFEGLSYQEISEVLGCPIGTVRSRLSRARTALQELLGDYLE